MGLFGSLLNLAADVVTTPIDIIKDVVNLPDIALGEKQSSTAKKLGQLGEDLDDVVHKAL